MNSEKLKKHIRLAIIILSIIIVLIVISVVIDKTSLENATYESNSDIPNNRAAVLMTKSSYIKEERSTSMNYYTDIYVTFGKLPYDGNESNEEYYYNLISALAEVNGYMNFRVIDEKNNITIGVTCDITSKTVTRILINGDPAFFARGNSNKELKNYKETPITDLKIQAKELSNLIKSNWDIEELELGEHGKMDEQYEWYPEEHLIIRTLRDSVFNIIFEKSYDGNVISGLKTKSTFDDVIKKLGEPTFGSKDGMYIGYKGKDIYVFFNGEYISIYPMIANRDKTKFIKNLNTYLKDDDLRTFVSSVTDIWDDYDSYNYSATLVDLSYILLGLKIQYNVTENHGITFYSNYVGEITGGKSFLELSNEEKSKDEGVEVPKYIYFSSRDAVDEYEEQRTRRIKMILYGSEETDYKE